MSKITMCIDLLAKTSVDEAIEFLSTWKESALDKMLFQDTDLEDQIAEAKEIAEQKQMEAEKSTPAPTPAPAPAPAPVLQTPEQPVAVVPAPVQPAPTPAPVQPTPQYDLNALSMAAAQLIQADSSKLALLQQSMQQFGVASIQEIPESRYGELAGVLQGLGASL